MRQLAPGLFCLASARYGWHKQTRTYPRQHSLRPTGQKNDLNLTASSQSDGRAPALLSRRFSPLKAFTLFLVTLKPTASFVVSDLQLSASGLRACAPAKICMIAKTEACDPISNRVLVIAGPIGVGKSAIAMEICQQLQGEIISVDSVHMYQNLEIGTNKPPPAHRERVPHHALDLCSSDEEFTPGDFYVGVLQAIKQVLSDGRVPVLVGGSLMYMQWILGGLPGSRAPLESDTAAAEVRELLEPMRLAGDWEAGVSILEQLDPGSTSEQSLNANDWDLLQSLLIAAVSKLDAEELAEEPAEESDGLEELRRSLDIRCFFLYGRRDMLFPRIDKMCEHMVTSGLLEETTEELLKGKLYHSSPGARIVSYGQAIAYLMQKKWRYECKKDFSKYLKAFSKAVRHQSRTQLKGFRAEPDFEWIRHDWTQPAKTIQQIVNHFQCEREAFDRALASPDQANLREVDQKVGAKVGPQPDLASTLDDTTVAELVARADACRTKLQRGAARDSRLSKYFKYGS